MLKSLEIQGFKSFPEYTEINFHKGITAIVGPNGAGKSNITDAIRWVLGEQSAKTLRGQRMEDVIFNGTAQRRPVSFSEVTLTLDNSKRTLPIDYGTVALTRRYYRSGESEYLINKTPCRLKDINALLMDTGIGLDGYSIIGQGRIDEILSNRSEDRRAIFEEASGIVQYRTRKDEALRKLDRSGHNLVRVDDLLAELRDQAVLLEKQAGHARSHVEMAARYRKLDTALTLRQIQKLEDQKLKREEDALLLKADLDQARETRAKVRSDYEASLSRIKSLDQALEEEQASFNAISVKETECMGLDALHKEKFAGSKKGAETLLEEKNRLLVQLMATEEELAGQEEKGRDLRSRRSSLEKELEEARSGQAEREAALEGTSRTINALQEKRENLAATLSSQQVSLREGMAEGQFLETRLERLRVEEEGLRQEEETSAASLDQRRRDRQALEAAIEEGEKEAVEARKLTETGHRNADLLQGAREDKSRSVKQLHYEIETLTRLESDFEGYTRPVQLLMKEVERTGKKGIHGPLGSLLTVPEPLQPALETALGAATHNLVCDGSGTAEDWIDWLGRAKAGRATFLPLDSLQPRPLDARTLATARTAEGWIGVAADLVQYDPAVKAAVLFVLGRTLLVESLDQAVDLSRKTGRAYNIVTRSGDQVNRGGSMTGGYRATRVAGVLGRPGRIKAARLEVDARQAEIEELTLRFEAAKEELREAGTKEEALLEALAADRRKLAGLMAEEEAGLAAHDRLRADLSGRREERGQLEKRLSELADDRTALEDGLARLGQALEGTVKELAGLEEGRQAGQADYNDKRDQLTRLEVTLKSLEETLADFDSRAEARGQEIEGARLRLASVEREWQDQTRRMEEARGAIEDNQAALDRAVTERKEVQDRLSQLLADREEELSRQGTLLAHMNKANDQLASLGAVCERQDSDIERLGLQVDDQLNSLWEAHGLTRSQAEAEVEDLGPISRATAERADLKRRIEELGPVNHNAIRDYEALEARIGFTASQRQDIERAQAELEAIVHDLDQSMREQFNRTFHEINQNFNQVFAELFSGGQAELVLEGEDDVLLADIGIRAQPPGKKLQKLSLLSGGERCLTAIALLFAILKLKPAPFCVFDEVESALDDANVKRFTDYVRRYAWSMQFILVTHRKGTMEASDRLYGVTMQERGISRVLSMVLSSALPYGD